MIESPTVSPFEVYAIKYATAARSSGDNFIGGDPHEAGDPLDFFVWLVRNSSRTFVVDTGANRAVAERRRYEFLRSPIDGLRLLGVDPARVEDVIMTHLHNDHAGNLDGFPSARFHLQDRELRYATGRHMGTPLFSHAYEAGEVAAMVRHVYAGRVEFHDGDAEIAPGLSVHLLGGHTGGSQAVRVWTRAGWIVLASDASHFYANMTQFRPFPIVADLTEMADGWRRLRQLADAPQHVVPGHDPLVMRQYPSPAPELEGIAVRLDAEPVQVLDP